VRDRPTDAAAEASRRSSPLMRRPLMSMVSEPDLQRPELIAGTRLWVVGVVFVGFLLAGLLAVHVYVLNVQGAAERARVDFVSQVQQRRKSLEDSLRTAGAVEQSATVVRSFDEVQAAPTLRGQIDASRELEAVLVEVRPLLASCSSCPTARRHIELLTQEQAEWREAHEAWMRATEEFPGWLAVELGLDHKPPPWVVP
jgi:hypothetical protein